MNHEMQLRVGVLYGPIMLALLAGLLQRGVRRLFAGCLLSFLWVLTTLEILQRVNLCAGWWSFERSAGMLQGMPVEMYVGWVVLWGLLPQMAVRRLPVVWAALVMVTLDLAAMPLLRPLVVLGPRWLIGETMAVGLVLMPALLLARWTMEERRLKLRAAMQVGIAGMLFLYLVPEVAFALGAGAGWQPLVSRPEWQLQAILVALLAVSLPGLGAVMEFAGRGLGTPIPYDPPRKIVTSGVYRYCANPMQMSCALAMILWALVLWNGWLLVAAAIGIAYSAGIAEWDEAVDLERRFGAEWVGYRANVKAWRWRYRPYVGGELAHVYVARTCGPCSEVRSWIEAQTPMGLEQVDAETLPAGSIRRMRYVCGDDAVEGVRAIGRVMEHLDVRWALLGAALRLPGVWWVVQVLMDVSGLGPREIGARVQKA